MMPLVSVGIPSYNHAPYLSDAIESVLGQSLRDVELVIADDGSSDGSLDICERYARDYPDRVTVLTHPHNAHRGIGATANLYRARLRGRYILGLGSDDILYPDTLRREVEFLESHPKVGFVYGYADRVDATGRTLAVRTFGADVTAASRAVERLVQGNKIPSMTAMVRRECLERVGPENETLVYGDWEFYTRLAAHFEVGFIPCTLAMQRIHGRNTSVTVSRETNLARAREVTAALRAAAGRIGGGLTQPRVQATLALQTAFLDFASGAGPGPDDEIRAAFLGDPSLAIDGDWLSEWLWNRLVDPLLPCSGPFFVPWIGARLLPLLQAEAAGSLRLEAAAARAAERAIRSARTGRARRAWRPALGAVARKPRRVADRRIVALLVDDLCGGVPLRLYLRAKRLLSRRRPRRYQLSSSAHPKPVLPRSFPQ